MFLISSLENCAFTIDTFTAKNSRSGLHSCLENVFESLVIKIDLLESGFEHP